MELRLLKEVLVPDFDGQGLDAELLLKHASGRLPHGTDFSGTCQIELFPGKFL